MESSKELLTPDSRNEAKEDTIKKLKFVPFYNPKTAEFLIQGCRHVQC